MRSLLALALAAPLLFPVAPALAQTSILGIELTPEQVALVDRQCNVLRFQPMRTLASEPPPPPPPGVIPSDKASYWAESPDRTGVRPTTLNLSDITEDDCREAGFYRQ